MPNEKAPRIPSYRLHKPTGLAVVRLSGKDFYLGKHGTAASQREYERLVAEWLANHGTPPGKAGQHAAPDAPLTVNELLVAYRRFAEAYYRKNGRPTDERYGIKAAMRRLQRFYGGKLASSFGPLALKTVRQQMIDAKHSRKYINDNVNRIKRLFRWGVAEELECPVIVVLSGRAVRIADASWSGCLCFDHGGSQCTDPTSVTWFG